MNHTELTATLKGLRLFAIAENYVEIAKAAEKKNLSYEKFLASLATVELAHKQVSKAKTLIKAAKFPKEKFLENYLFDGRRGITSATVSRLAAGAWVKNSRRRGGDRL